MQNYTFLTRRQYFETLVSLIDQASADQPVYVVTMTFDPSQPIIEALVAALIRAAGRGVTVTLLVDAFNFLVMPNGILPGPRWLGTPYTSMRGGYAATYAALERIRVAGGVYQILNEPTRRRVPFAGRSHIKAAIIGDQVLIGGCNLERPGDSDIMITWSDVKATHQLKDWFDKLVKRPYTVAAFGASDSIVTLHDTTQLLLDAGVPDQSTIYDHALQLIDDADEWLYITCQYFPGGPTADHLAAAIKRGVAVTVTYSHPKAHGQAAFLYYYHQFMQRHRGLPTELFAHRMPASAPKLHAKILSSEKTVLVGSHNYVRQGVRLGTAELALRVTDSAFIADLREFTQSLIGSVHL